MTNKNVSQLPTNSDPQDSDWLLGASGNSPSVFQKIPVGAIVPAQSSGGSVNFTQVNSPVTITQSGYYFTDLLSKNLLVTFTNPPLGTYIKWFNDSTNKVVLSGFTSLDETAIPTNQGIAIAPGNYMEFYVNNGNKNVKTLSGTYFIYWIPGQEPPFIDLTYSSNNDTNDLFYYLGTNKRTDAWANPTTRTSLCTITATNWSQSAINSLTNRANGLAGATFNQYGPDYTVTLLQNMTFKPNKFIISANGMGNNPLPGRIDLKIRKLSGDTWTTVAQVNLSTKEIYYVVNVNTTIEASQIRVSFGALPDGSFPEIYLYGTLLF